jgi:hypothetical protein
MGRLLNLRGLFMPLPSALQDKENYKFLDAGTNQTSVRVSLASGMSPERYDEVQVTYPTTTTEVYTFKLATTTVGVITVTYTDTTKDFIQSVVRS